jgi:hypothetical protein
VGRREFLKIAGIAGADPHGWPWAFGGSETMRPKEGP